VLICNTLKLQRGNKRIELNREMLKRCNAAAQLILWYKVYTVSQIRFMIKKSIVSVQIDENRKVLDVTISRGCVNSSPTEINFISVAADGAKENRTILRCRPMWRYTRIPASRESNLQDYALFGAATVNARTETTDSGISPRR